MSVESRPVHSPITDKWESPLPCIFHGNYHQPWMGKVTHFKNILFIYLYLFGGGGEEGEGDSQADFMLSAEPDVGLDPSASRPWPELKWVERWTDWAPPGVPFLAFYSSFIETQFTCHGIHHIHALNVYNSVVLANLEGCLYDHSQV